MIETVLNLVTMLFGLVGTIAWIISVGNETHEPPCDHDCDTCPFPKCEDK